VSVSVIRVSKLLHQKKEGHGHESLTLMLCSYWSHTLLMRMDAVG